MNTYNIISTVLTLSMFFTGLFLFIKYVSPSFKKAPVIYEEYISDIDAYLEIKTHMLTKLGYSLSERNDNPLNGVTYTCNNGVVILLKLKSDRKCGGLFINEMPLYLDLSAHCEISLHEGAIFCLHTHIEIEYFKVFEKDDEL